MLLDIIQKYNSQNILIIDELSFLEITSNKFNIPTFYKEIQNINKNTKIYVISNHIQQNCNRININPQKYIDVHQYFKNNNIVFDFVIDLNQKNIITQLSNFSLIINKTRFGYFLKKDTQNKNIDKLIYNLKKFNENVINERDFLFVKIEKY